MSVFARSRVKWVKTSKRPFRKGSNMDHGAQAYRRYLDGDDGGLVELIRDYQQGLTVFLCSVTGSIAEAEEIMEDVFFRLAVKKPKFKGKSSFKTWLYAIGRNAALDHVRRRSRYAEKPVEEYLNDRPDAGGPEADYLREETNRALYRCIERLHADYRQALTLSYFEALSNDQIASVMKKNKRQVENLLTRARAALKKELEKEGIDHEDL